MQAEAWLQPFWTLPCELHCYGHPEAARRVSGYPPGTHPALLTALPHPRQALRVPRSLWVTRSSQPHVLHGREQQQPLAPCRSLTPWTPVAWGTLGCQMC